MLRTKGENKKFIKRTLAQHVQPYMCNSYSKQGYPAVTGG